MTVPDHDPAVWTDPEPTLWTIGNNVHTTLSNGRVLLQRTGGNVSIWWWPDGRVAPVDPNHLVVDDEIRLACHRCKVRPVPDTWSFVQLCDQCLTTPPPTEASS